MNSSEVAFVDRMNLCHPHYGTGPFRELGLTEKSANLPADTFNFTTMKEDLNSIEDSDNYENWPDLSLL